MGIKGAIKGVAVTDVFLHKLVEAYFQNPGEPLEDASQIFSYWREQNPEELNEHASAVNVNLEDLVRGDVSAGIKVLTQEDDPMRAMERRLEDPLLKLRSLIFRPINDDTKKALNDVGYRRLAEDVTLIDVIRSTDFLTSVVFRTLNLYGFVEVQNHWEGIFGGKSTKFGNFAEITETPIALPYDDYVLHVGYSRGRDEVNLRVHFKTQEDARKGDFDGRTLIGNCKLIDLPAISYDEMILRYHEVGRDPLALAFQDGKILELTRTLPDGRVGRQWAYHPRLLLEKLAEKLDNPAHSYFFLRAAGHDTCYIDRPDWDRLAIENEKQLLRRQTGQAIPAFRKDKTPKEVKMMLGFDRRPISVDVSDYRPLLATENSKRLEDVMSLGNLFHQRLGYALQSRRNHMVGVLHVARMLCDRLGIKGYDRRKVEVYALEHDIGTLTGSHATEDHLRRTCGFDHEEFAKEIIREQAKAYDGIIDPEDLIAMFEGKDPLHDMVDGVFGADRLYYLSIDAHETGEEKKHDPLKLITWLYWDPDLEKMVCASPEEAYKFLDLRAHQFETIYFKPTTQIADAYQKKMLWKAGINDPYQTVPVEHNNHLDFLPREGFEVPFWKFTDEMFQYVLANHDDIEVREVMRHLLVNYHRAPHATCATLKVEGQEETEQAVQIPLYHDLTYGRMIVAVEGVQAETLKAYHKKWQQPDLKAKLEEEIAKRSGIPERHVVVASVPNLSKLASEEAHILFDGKVSNLFEVHPEYQQTFVDRANRMTSLRVATHPQLWPELRAFFEENSFADIVKDVYG